MLILSVRSLDKAKIIRWNPSDTAIIVCDMWDRHTCKSAERRIGEIALRLNGFLQSLRKKGGFVIHAPSDVMQFYENTPERQRAKVAPFAAAPISIDWQDLDFEREGILPVDDADWCDDTPKCPIQEIENKKAWPWTRQHAAIKIHSEDAVTCYGQEIYNLLEQRGIKNIIMTGVHLNRCVLGRPYGIRQMVKLGKHVVLARDLTDGLYDPRQYPYASREQGIGLLVRHVEKFWCPSIQSSDIS